MHSEYYQVTEEAANTINETKKNGGRVICVGTTSCRTVESAADEQGMVQPGCDNTEIFIYPGYRFKVLVSSHNLRELEDVCDHVGIMNQGKVLLERSLSELQDTTVKLQVVYPGDEPRLPAELNILHHSAVGRVHTYILRGDRESILNRMQITAPLLLEAIPLTLEEIFIYELGGADYAVRDIVL